MELNGRSVFHKILTGIVHLIHLYFFFCVLHHIGCFYVRVRTAKIACAAFW